MTTCELKELWYNAIYMTMEEFIEVVRADERARILDAVYECGWHCEVHSKEALIEMVDEQLKEGKNDGNNSKME